MDYTRKKSDAVIRITGKFDSPYSTHSFSQFMWESIPFPKKYCKDDVIILVGIC